MTWGLIALSFRALRTDKKLAWFPVLSAIGVAAVTIPYFWAATGAAPWQSSGLRWAGPVAWLWLFLWYCTASFVIVFFNCALAACARVRFAGRQPAIADGLRQAGRRTGRILAWAVVASTAGVVIHLIQRCAGWLGRLAGTVAGIGWSLATYLIVPVLVIEDRSVLESLRRSRELLRSTWGEQLVAGVHFFWILVFLTIPGLVLGALALPAGVAYFAMLAVTVSAARSIFVVALYQYAATGVAPAGYFRDAPDGAPGKR